MENIFVSLNNHDYAGFSRDFGSTVKNALNQTAFNQLFDQVKASIGEFQSVLYVSDAVQNGVNIIVYVAHYSGEPAGLTATLGLQAVEGRYQVQGLNFYSPNLAGQPLDVQQIRSYADPETDTVLSSLNTNDYAAFSRDFNAVMKNAVPESAFAGLYSQQKSTVGDYQNSREFESASSQNGIVTIRYLAKYANEPGGVWVTISFDANHKIAGLLFNSPKLTEAAQSR
jgi:hypothetical protein